MIQMLIVAGAPLTSTDGPCLWDLWLEFLPIEDTQKISSTFQCLIDNGWKPRKTKIPGSLLSKAVQLHDR